MPLITTEAALPVIKTLQDCADLSKTVIPYLPQLQQLPQQIFAHINDFQALKTIYISTNPLITALAFSLFVSPIFLIAAEVNKNYSQVDRFWSILPIIYNVHYDVWAHLVGLPTNRLDHVMAVTLIWGARLTFNYWRKGGYQIGSEDYRWETVKNYLGPVGMFIFDVFFISFGQNFLLFLITTPTYVLLNVSRVTGGAMDATDNFFSRLQFFIVVIEYFSDQQQWNFHQAKQAYQKTAQVPKSHSYTQRQLDRGFNTSGLFAYSRHPNFAAEQAFWVLLYQWSCLSSQRLMNWAWVGTLGYLILFQASTWFTEYLTAGKYPEYKTYQAKVGKFLPKLGSVWREPVEETQEEGNKGPKAKGAENGKGKSKKR